MEDSWGVIFGGARGGEISARGIVRMHPEDNSRVGPSHRSSWGDKSSPRRSHKWDRSSKPPTINPADEAHSYRCAQGGINLSIRGCRNFLYRKKEEKKKRGQNGHSSASVLQVKSLKADSRICRGKSLSAMERVARDFEGTTGARCWLFVLRMGGTANRLPAAASGRTG